MRIIAIVTFLSYASFASAMDHSAETPSSDRVRLFATTLTHAELPVFLQKNHKSIQKLEISHSNIDPRLFRNLPAGLKKLSLTAVKDLHGNTLSVHQFLENTRYFNNLKSLTLEN